MSTRRAFLRSLLVAPLAIGGIARALVALRESLVIKTDGRRGITFGSDMTLYRPPPYEDVVYAYGCASRAQAERYGRWILHSSRQCGKTATQVAYWNVAVNRWATTGLLTLS